MGRGLIPVKIGLIDVDGHNFPNLALMRISAYHKAKGDTVEWWWSDFIHYDIVYMSKVFSSTYSRDVPEPINADRVIKGVYAAASEGRDRTPRPQCGFDTRPPLQKAYAKKGRT